MNDKDVEAQLQSGTLDGGDSCKERGEEEAVQSTSRMERTCTPATVAEPDSTMSNEAGDQMIPASMELAESHAMVDYVTDRRNGMEAARYHVL